MSELEPLQPDEKELMTKQLHESFFSGRSTFDNMGSGHSVGENYNEFIHAITEATTIEGLYAKMVKKAEEMKAAAEADSYRIDSEAMEIFIDSILETCRTTFCNMRDLDESDVFGEDDEHNAEIIPLFGEGRRPTIH